jgi:Ca-activated chloride channel family protein
VPISDESRIKAHELLETLNANGSTNLYDGLSLALKRLDDDRATNVVLVTDAVTNTGVVNPQDFYKLLQKFDVRVFGFLLGNSANWPLMQTISETSGGFYDAISNTDDIMGKIMMAGNKIRYEALLDASVKISGVKTFNLTDETFKKVYRGEQLVIFGKYQKGGDARVTLKANLTGEDKTYSADFKFPDLDTNNPELERLWAMATIEKIESQERIGRMPPSESESAIRDLGLSHQIVTDYTSMVVLSESAFAERGIERHNQTRIAREQRARTTKSQQPVKSHRVDDKKPAFKFKAPSLGGGGGAVDPLTGGLAILFSAIAGVKLLMRRKK